MASSHDNQKSQMMEDVSYFTEKFIEGSLSVKIGTKVLYRDIQGYIADAFNNMKTQNPYFVSQGKGTEVFADYTEAMQALKKEWYPDHIREMEAEYPSNEEEDLINVKPVLLDDELVKKIDQILAKSVGFRFALPNLQVLLFSYSFVFYLFSLLRNATANETLP
ncbi:hypothetical protein NIES4074_50620 [Cylindrospermum sp. NIES-4074]|nr:hypothetical protein NIES4074_50620 [Cylindrospermum sp. NIES-4074]